MKFSFMGTHASRQKHDVSGPGNMEFNVLVSSRPIYLSCKFENLIFEMAPVIKHFMFKQYISLRLFLYHCSLATLLPRDERAYCFTLIVLWLCFPCLFSRGAVGWSEIVVFPGHTHFVQSS